MKTSSEKTIEKYQEVLKSASSLLILYPQDINLITTKYRINKTWYSYAVRLGILERNDRGVYKMFPYKATRENATKLLKTMNEKQNKLTAWQSTITTNMLDHHDVRDENIIVLNASDEELVNELRNRGYTVTAEKHITL